MKASDKILRAFESFRKHIVGHKTATELFFEGIKEVEILEGLLELKEKERKEWAELSIRKQIKIDNALNDLMEAHNLLAKSNLPMEIYTPISEILAKVKLDLFNPKPI